MGVQIAHKQYCGKWDVGSSFVSLVHALFLLHVLSAVHFVVSKCLWRALGTTRTSLVHLLANFFQHSCTNSLNFNGFCHTFFSTRIPI